MRMGTRIGAAGVLLALGTASAAARTTDTRWVASWSAAPCAAAEAEPRFSQAELNDTTVRQIVHLSAGGASVRLRFANTFGSAPLAIRSVYVAQKAASGGTDAATAVPVTVGGQAAFSIPAGKSVQTDAAKFAAGAATDIAVSFFVPGKTTVQAVHYTALETSYEAKGEQTQAARLKDSWQTTLRLSLTSVDVAADAAPYSIVAIGSSTTDGAHSTSGKNMRWTDDLYRRLHDARGDAAPAVVNVGISGNRVLHDGRGEWGAVWGQAAIGRFNRDVLMQSGGGYVIAFEGGNDIRMPGSGSVGLEETVTPQQLIAAFRLMAKASHDRGLKFLAGTITPFEHADNNRAENPLWENTRLAFNEWVRHNTDTDGVVDFDAAVRDPGHPARILARYDSGDHLHPNDAGYQAMADSIDLKLFR